MKCGERRFAAPGRTDLLLVLAIFLLAVPQAALLPLLDRDEPRFAEASREMRQSGNYIVPTFDGAPRYAKPPLIYWCQALSFSIFGETPFAARFPSLVAVAATAFLLYRWGLRLATPRTGLIAGLAYGLCLQVVQQGRVATADALLIFFMTLTGYAGWRLLALATNCAADGAWNYWGLVLALGLGGGFLAKGPEALLPFVPLMVVARTKGRGVRLSFAALLALALLFVSLWAVPAFVQTHGDYWREGLGHDVGERMVTGFQGHGASTFGWYLLGVPLYLLTFWISALPSSPLLLTHRRTLLRTGPLDETDRYLLGNVLIVFIVFSLIVTKLLHYTLPAFPFLALFFARRWMRADASPTLPERVTIYTGLALAVFAMAAIPAALNRGLDPSPVGELVRDAGDALAPDTRFALVDFREPNAIWEMRRTVARPAIFLADNDVISFLHQPGARAVVLSTSLWRLVAGKAEPGWKIYRERGFNAARFSFPYFAPLDLTLAIKPAS